MESYNSLKSNLQERIAAVVETSPVSDVVCVGHSLGGSTAALALLDLALEYNNRFQYHLYTFGAPPVGNSDFSELFKSKVTQNSLLYVNRLDLVPRSLDVSHTLNDKLSKIFSKLSSSEAGEWVRQPYCHVSDVITLDQWMKVSTDAAKVILANKAGLMSIPKYFSSNHLMTSYIENLALKSSNMTLSLQSRAGSLTKSVVPVVSATQKVTKNASKMASQITGLAGLSILTTALTNYHIYHVHKSLNQKMEAVESAIINHTDNATNRAIADIKEAMSAVELRAVKSCKDFISNSLEVASSRIEDMENSIHMQIAHASMKQLCLEYQRSTVKTRLEADNVIRSYECGVNDPNENTRAVVARMHNSIAEMQANVEVLRRELSCEQFYQYEFTALTEECRSYSIELVVMSLLNLQIAERKMQLIFDNDMIVQNCFCSRVASWIYRNGAICRDQALALSQVSSSMLLIGEKCATDFSSAMISHNEHCIDTVACLSEKFCKTLLPDYVSFATEYGVANSIPIFIKHLCNIAKNYNSLVHASDTTTMYTMDYPRYDSESILVNLLTSTNESWLIGALSELHNSNSTEIVARCYHCLCIMAISEEDRRKVLSCFHTSLNTVEESVIHGIYKELLTFHQQPHKVTDSFTSNFDAGVKERCYVSAMNAGILSGNIFLRNLDGIYEGQYKQVHSNDTLRLLRNGYGKFQYRNGDIYDGMWVDDNRHGEGVYTLSRSRAYVAGEISYRGEWFNDKKHGAGATTSVSGVVSHGTWVNGSVV